LYQFRGDVQKYGIDLDIQPANAHQNIKSAMKIARSLPYGCCCLSDTGNEILFTINISPPFPKIAGLDAACLCLGLPGYRTSNQWNSSSGATLKPVDSEEDSIARIVNIGPAAQQI
jgi:hypothetical protein